MASNLGGVRSIVFDPDAYHTMDAGQIASDMEGRLRGFSGVVVVKTPQNGGMSVWEPVLRTALAYSSQLVKLVGNEWFFSKAQSPELYGAGSIVGNPQSGYYLRGSSKKDEVLEAMVA